jgi:hypothetical protein
VPLRGHDTPVSIAGPLFTAFRRLRGKRDVIIEVTLDEPV